MRAKDALPQPTRNAKTVLGVLGCVFTEAPILSTITSALRLLQDRKIEAGQRIILDAIRRDGLDQLNELNPAQIDFFVPAAYRFLEQVRLGEYEHILGVPAGLISRETSRATDSSDVGKVGRTARRLEMMSPMTLECLARCERAFELHRQTSQSGEFAKLLTVQDVFNAMEDPQANFHLDEAFEAVNDMVWRGILTKHYGVWEDSAERSLYRATAAYDEVIAAVTSLE